MIYEEIVSELFIEFPELYSVDHSIEDLKLPYYVFGSGVLVLEVQKLINENTVEADKLLGRYFQFIEQMISEGDERTIALAVVGFLEGLTNTKGYESKAKKYMGPLTKDSMKQLNKFWRGF